MIINGKNTQKRRNIMEKASVPNYNLWSINSFNHPKIIKIIQNLLINDYKQIINKIIWKKKQLIKIYLITKSNNCKGLRIR